MISAVSVTYEGGGIRAWYFEPVDRAAPPYTKQIKVTAVIDVAADGTFAGLEVIDARMPPPFIVKQAAGE